MTSTSAYWPSRLCQPTVSPHPASAFPALVHAFVTCRQHPVSFEGLRYLPRPASSPLHYCPTTSRSIPPLNRYRFAFLPVPSSHEPSRLLPDGIPREPALALFPHRSFSVNDSSRPNPVRSILLMPQLPRFLFFLASKPPFRPAASAMSRASSPPEGISRRIRLKCSLALR